MRTCATKTVRAGRLLLTGCPEKRATQPVGPSLAGNANSARHVMRFFRRQSNGKDNRDAFFREARPTHFLLHKKVKFRKRKCLTLRLTFVYKRLVSKFETAACQNNARTSLVRLANRRHPAQTGAGRERLAMKARSLKIEKTGDFCYGRIIPRIRIAGQWLEQAGFKPGHRVEIRFAQPGNLTLHFQEQTKEVAL